MWKIHDRKIKETGQPEESPSSIRSSNSIRGPADMMAVVPDENATATEVLRIPKLYTTGSMVAATNKRSYPNAHAYHVNALSVNPDGETFISADDLRINLWNMHVTNQSFSTSFLGVVSCQVSVVSQADRDDRR